MCPLTDLAGMDGREGFMKKSFSIDSSLSMVSHHAAPRSNADRPAQHCGRGIGLTGLKTLHEDRGRSPPGASPRSPPPPLTPLSLDDPVVLGTPQSAAVPLDIGAGTSGRSGSSLRSALLVAATALAVLGAAIILAPASLSQMMGVAPLDLASADAGGGSGVSVNATQIAAGCADIEVAEGFDMARFLGDWHTIAWLHASSEASAWEKAVAHKCTTATFSLPPPPAAARGQRRSSKRQAPAYSAAGSLGGGGGGPFEVTFMHRPEPEKPAGREAGSGKRSLESTTVVAGAGSVPEAGAPARLQVRLDTGHVLPYHVVSTDYTSWALMCTTSASLGGQKPAQVLALLSRSWAHDRLDVGDRLNELAERNLPWKEAVFAPSAACAAAAAE